MPWPLFCKLMDEVAPHIEELYFYNYGEPFLHPKALDMLAYAKKLNPRITVTTSTNGILLSRAGKAERIVAEGLVDWICFTIAGVNQSTYIRYHKSGSFEKAFEAMRLVLEAKRRYGKTKPFVHWRYLLFNWNDSDDCIEEALRLKRLIGVDDFKFMLTASPIEGRSLRRAPGTPGFDAIREFLSYQDDYNPDPYAESGLYGLESNQELGAFRWSATKARFKLKSFNGGLNLRLARIAADLGPAQVVTLRLPWTEITANLGSGTWSDNLIELPRDFYQAEVPIELEVDRPFVPMRYIGGTDNRSLGVMISMPGVMPAQNPFRNSAAAVSRPAEASR